MSWSVTTGASGLSEALMPGEELDQWLDDHKEGVVQVHSHKQTSEAAGEQYEAACEAVRELVQAVGRPGDKVYVDMMGHANPEHAPSQSGVANEEIMVRVRAQHANDVTEAPSVPPEAVSEGLKAAGQSSGSGQSE